ncbi:hypothetical protein AGABI2DRAFT_191035 [Agaricus bisporus var. bisporus H97]|uniref:hypothetical protein n=1 Tax=Agaricus bisporus var. bisporus (strain H97 / ATCC MYA-4626 / FGSC 10389) TaxID=936046 RepID=UPI00029F7BA2|nr:hypothetical protein AGABI2DRAFT_191035 [Agaricus bisporus var. bisporus H97]EKV48827.1 hypothetical protein AGABI2DRAFT_191035 [Agaricus bisporus var. bisporus H97]
MVMVSGVWGTISKVVRVDKGAFVARNNDETTGETVHGMIYGKHIVVVYKSAYGNGRCVCLLKGKDADIPLRGRPPKG